jgi:hypothetical protein
MAGVLRACAQPDEVVTAGIGNLDIGGFSVIKKGDLVAECSVDRTGSTKIYFPIEPGAVLLSFVAALTGKGKDPNPSGFHFLGPPGDALVLSVALRELREDQTPLTDARLANAVARTIDSPKLSAAFTIAAGTDAIKALGQPAELAKVIDRLIAAGHLIGTDEGSSAPEELQELLGEPPEATAGITRTVVANGTARSTTLSLMRVGGRKLVFRERHGSAGPQFEWIEVNRKMLRGLIGALLAVPGADSEVDAANISPAALHAPSAEPPRPPAKPKKAPKPATPPPQVTTGSTWAPTHRIPAEGLPVWEAPGAQAPTATAEGGLEVKVLGWNGAWAQVEFTNGWSGWLDGRYLSEV